MKLSVDPTNVCHLRCPLCPTGQRTIDRPHGHLDLLLFERLLEELGDYLFFMDFFNWGEPLLNTHVETLISRAEARGIICTLSTSLSLPLDDARIHRLVTSGLHEMIVSLDGATQETYAQYRKGGDFSLVCANIAKLVAEKRRLGVTRPLITWQYVVFRHNEHEKDRARELAKQFGVDRICFRAPLLDTERPEIATQERDALISWAPEDRAFRIPRKHPQKSSNTCSWHYMSPAVNADGAVAPCTGVHSRTNDFGTLVPSGNPEGNGERTYMNLVNNANYRSVRDRFAGRSLEPGSSICDACPVPSIKDHHKHLNREIAILTAVTLWRRVIGRQRTRLVE
ncbi:MAG: radical SAM protein [Acidobacteriota bacterium]